MEICLSTITDIIPKKDIRWTPALIRRLRGKRTQSDFGALVGATTNTVWRWEAGHAEPDSDHARQLSNLAKSEQFLKDWKLAGSGILVDDLESASRKLSQDLETTLGDRARRLWK